MSELEEKIISVGKLNEPTEVELRRVKEANVSENSTVKDSESRLRDEMDQEKEKNFQLECEVERLAKGSEELENQAQSKALALEEGKKILDN